MLPYIYSKIVYLSSYITLSTHELMSHGLQYFFHYFTLTSFSKTDGVDEQMRDAVSRYRFDNDTDAERDVNSAMNFVQGKVSCTPTIVQYFLALGM